MHSIYPCILGRLALGLGLISAADALWHRLRSPAGSHHLRRNWRTGMGRAAVLCTCCGGVHRRVWKLRCCTGRWMAAVLKRCRNCPGTKLRRGCDGTVAACGCVGALWTWGSRLLGLPGLMFAILPVPPFCLMVPLGAIGADWVPAPMRWPGVTGPVEASRPAAPAWAGNAPGRPATRPVGEAVLAPGRIAPVGAAGP